MWGGKATAPKCIVRRRESAFPVFFKSILVDSEKVLFILATSNSPLHPFMHPKFPTARHIKLSGLRTEVVRILVEQ